MKKNLISVLFFLLISNSVFAISNGNNCAVVLRDSTHTFVDENNMVVQTSYEKIKILNTRGREVFGDIKRRFNAKKQEFEIIKAHTIRPDGELVQPVKSGISVVSAPEVGYATQYTNMQMQVVSFPALEPGAIIEYKYKIISQESSEHLPSGKIIWQENYPVKKKIFKLTFPQNKEDDFRFKLKKTEIAPEISKQDEDVTYCFEMKDITRIKREANRPSNSELSPLLFYGFNKSWQDALQDYQDEFYHATDVTKDLQQKIETLSLDEGKEVEQIVNFVKQDIRNVKLYFYKGISQLYSADQVLNNMYGTPQDKAVLLVSLLQSIGVDAYPVLVSNRDVKDLESALPFMKMFSYIIVAIPRADGIVYVSPSNQFCQYGWLPYRFQDREAVMLKPAETDFVHIPLSKLEDSISLSTLEAQIDKFGNLSGEFEIEGFGYYDQKLRHSLKFKNLHLQKLYFNSFVNAIRNGAELIDFSLTNPEFLQQNMLITVEFEIPNFVTIQGDRKKVKIPKPAIISAQIRNYTSSKSREYTLQLGPPRSVSYEFNIGLPDYKAAYLPAGKLNFENVADFQIDSSFEDKALEFRMDYQYHKTHVPTENYSDFKQFQNGYFNQNNWLLLFN